MASRALKPQSVAARMRLLAMAVCFGATGIGPCVHAAGIKENGDSARVDSLLYWMEGQITAIHALANWIQVNRDGTQLRIWLDTSTLIHLEDSLLALADLPIMFPIKAECRFIDGRWRARQVHLVSENRQAKQTKISGKSQARDLHSKAAVGVSPKKEKERLP